MFQHILAKTSSKFCGHLYVNNLASSMSSSKWKKLFCVLQDSGIYYSTKNNSLVSLVPKKTYIYYNFLFILKHGVFTVKFNFVSD